MLDVTACWMLLMIVQYLKHLLVWERAHNEVETSVTKNIQFFWEVMTSPLTCLHVDYWLWPSLFPPVTKWW